MNWTSLLLEPRLKVRILGIIASFSTWQYRRSPVWLQQKILRKKAGDQVWIGPGWQAHSLRRRLSVVDFTQCELIWSGTVSWTNTHNLHTIISYRFVCRICTWVFLNVLHNFLQKWVHFRGSNIRPAHGCKCSQYKRTVVIFFLMSARCPDVLYLVIAGQAKFNPTLESW